MFKRKIKNKALSEETSELSKKFEKKRAFYGVGCLLLDLF